MKITIENHWGLCANPMNIRIIMDEVNHPYCECTPDFCNWENEYHLFHGLEAVMPYTHTHVHAKYWDRWKTPEKDWNDVAAQRPHPERAPLQGHDRPRVGERADGRDRGHEVADEGGARGAVDELEQGAGLGASRHGSGGPPTRLMPRPAVPTPEPLSSTARRQRLLPAKIRSRRATTSFR